MKPLRVSQKDLAGWLALGARHVRQLTTMGILRQDAAHTYDLKTSVQAYLIFIRSKTGAATTERARLLKSQADLSELKFRQKEGELILVADVIKKEFALGRRIHDGMKNVPARTAAILAAESNQHTVHAILTKEIHQVLEELTHAQSQ